MQPSKCGPPSAVRGVDVSESDWKLQQQKHGKVTRNERKEWKEYVTGTGM